MTAMLLSLGILVVGAAAAVAFGRTRMHGPAPFFAAAGSAVSAAAGLYVLVTGETWHAVASWHMPLGALHIGLDALSAVFVLMISVVGVLAAVYGLGYLGKDSGDGKIAMSWCWFNLLMAAMLMVVMARDGFLFLMSWEIMSLTSFFLVMHDHQKEGVVRAGWIYLVATHLGTAFLLIMFLLLSQDGSLDFTNLAATGSLTSFVFCAALIGFGAKAGFVPLHIWLPEAHPAAPSHVSALMSGVMIKTGIYGILRVATLLGEPAAWWGWTLVGIGVLSGIGGVLFALVQHDLKRLLAYSSVENIGIIALGLGIGMLGISADNAGMAALGFCGALLHMINHSIFKSLLFFGAGSVLHATGTLHIDHLGGLLKRMPVTGAAFIVGTAAICGLPPLCGFVGEFLIYAAAFTGVGSESQVWSGLVVIAGLALIGGLVIACFAKAAGIVFLGEPRSPAAEQAREGPLSMLWPMVTLAVFCLCIGLASPWMVRLVLPAVAGLVPQAASTAIVSELTGMLAWISLMALLLIGLTALLLAVRAGLLRNRIVRSGPTWDCGFAAPTARMQYTGSSFSQPMAWMFKMLLRTRMDIIPPEDLFSGPADLRTHTPDLLIHRVYAPTVRLLSGLAAGFRQVQQGQTHLYILYIVMTILLLLIWNLW